MTRHADKDNIKKWLEAIDRFNSTPGEGTTRILFTEPEINSRSYIKEEMKKIGLQVSEDAIGNIFGILPGAEPGLAPVWTGSHIDTVPNGGMFDGMAGVVSGLEALRLIKESGGTLRRNLALVVYTSEEPTRFGLSCLGSRAMAGKMSLDDTKSIVDENGESLYDILESLGYDHREYDGIKRGKGDVYAALELHIEQNRNLDRAGIPVGIVRGICAPTIYEVTITGSQSHAVGTSMADRRDAYAAASELTLAVERLARESQGEYLTGTVGKVEVIPNAVNVISGCVHLTVDIRSIDMESKELFMRRLEREAVRIEKERNVQIEMKLENHDAPLRCDRRIMELLKGICSDLHIPNRELISGPYHDSLFVGGFAPVAMLFVPSKDGISHSREEWTDFEDIALGTDVLANALLALANE